jgi:hypothetical protein
MAYINHTSLSRTIISYARDVGRLNNLIKGSWNKWVRVSCYSAISEYLWWNNFSLMRWEIIENGRIFCISRIPWELRLKSLLWAYCHQPFRLLKLNWLYFIHKALKKILAHKVYFHNCTLSYWKSNRLPIAEERVKN